MEVRINNLLEMSLTNEDVTSFVDIVGTLKDAIIKQSKKVGFKKNGTINIDLSDESIEFIMTLCDTAGIMTEDEVKEQTQE